MDLLNNTTLGEGPENEFYPDISSFAFKDTHLDFDALSTLELDGFSSPFDTTFADDITNISNGFLHTPQKPSLNTSDFPIDSFHRVAKQLKFGACTEFLQTSAADVDLYLECNEDNFPQQLSSRPPEVPAEQKISDDIKISFDLPVGNVISTRYNCNQCQGRSFNRPSKLLEHLAVSHGVERLYHCTQCVYVANRYKALQQHHIRVHKKRMRVADIDGKHLLKAFNELQSTRGVKIASELPSDVTGSNTLAFDNAGVDFVTINLSCNGSEVDVPETLSANLFLNLSENQEESQQDGYSVGDIGDEVLLSTENTTALGDLTNGLAGSGFLVCEGNDLVWKCNDAQQPGSVLNLENTPKELYRDRIETAVYNVITLDQALITLNDPNQMDSLSTIKSCQIQDFTPSQSSVFVTRISPRASTAQELDCIEEPVTWVPEDFLNAIDIPKRSSDTKSNSVISNIEVATSLPSDGNSGRSLCLFTKSKTSTSHSPHKINRWNRKVKTPLKDNCCSQNTNDLRKSCPRKRADVVKVAKPSLFNGRRPAFVDDSKYSTKSDGAEKCVASGSRDIPDGTATATDSARSFRVDYIDGRIVLIVDSAKISEMPNYQDSDQVATDSPDSQECINCNKIFRSISALNKHVMRVHGARHYKCVAEGCNKAYCTRYDLKAHMQQHTNLYMCTYFNCKMVFRDQYNLKSHCMTHTAEYPFKCDMCDYKCRNRAVLRYHTRSRH